MALGDMLTSIVSNYHFGKRPGARDITIFSIHALYHVNNKICSLLMIFDYCQVGEKSEFGYTTYGGSHFGNKCILQLHKAQKNTILFFFHFGAIQLEKIIQGADSMIGDLYISKYNGFCLNSIGMIIVISKS